MAQSRKNQKSIADQQVDEEALVPANKGAFPRSGNVSIDFQGGLLLGAALLTESTLLHMAHSKGQAVTIRFLASVNFLMVFAFYFYRVWTRRPDAGQTVYLFCMLPFILVLVGIALWGAIEMAIH